MDLVKCSQRTPGCTERNFRLEGQRFVNDFWNAPNFWPSTLQRIRAIFSGGFCCEFYIWKENVWFLFNIQNKPQRWLAQSNCNAYAVEIADLVEGDGGFFWRILADFDWKDLQIFFENFLRPRKTKDCEVLSSSSSSSFILLLFPPPYPPFSSSSSSFFASSSFLILLPFFLRLPDLIRTRFGKEKNQERSY